MSRGGPGPRSARKARAGVRALLRQGRSAAVPISRPRGLPLRQGPQAPRMRRAGDPQAQGGGRGTAGRRAAALTFPNRYPRARSTRRRADRRCRHRSRSASSSSRSAGDAEQVVDTDIERQVLDAEGIRVGKLEIVVHHGIQRMHVRGGRATARSTSTDERRPPCRWRAGGCHSSCDADPARAATDGPGPRPAARSLVDGSRLRASGAGG